jgi:hypothetical protein
MENSDRSCCGGDRCRKLDSGTPVRVAFGGVGCACAERWVARLEDPAVAPVGHGLASGESGTRRHYFAVGRR